MSPIATTKDVCSFTNNEFSSARTCGASTAMATIIILAQKQLRISGFSMDTGRVQVDNIYKT
jgi:hypothetical protein